MHTQPSSSTVGQRMSHLGVNGLCSDIGFGAKLNQQVSHANDITNMNVAY